MPMRRNLSMPADWTVLLGAYAGALIVFLAADMAWLVWIARPFYQSGLGHLLAERPRLAAAAVFYMVYVAGIVYFAVLPHLAGGALLPVFLSGLLLGLIAYGTYDATNYATLRDWPLTVSLVDTTWGMLLTAGSAVAGHAAGRLVSG